ncbi:MAG: PspC domain-containing protein [Bacteroidales bacterium]
MNTTKRLYRSTQDRYIAGVCGGLSQYLNTDVVIIRILFFVALILGGGGLLAYIVLWIVIPEEPLNQHNMESNQYAANPDDDQSQSSDFSDRNAEPNDEDEMKQSMRETKHMRRRQRDNLTGGIILISIGILFLIDNLVPGINFSDLWPIFLIIAGVIILVNNVKHSKNE